MGSRPLLCWVAGRLRHVDVEVRRSARPVVLEQTEVTAAVESVPDGVEPGCLSLRDRDWVRLRSQATETGGPDEELVVAVGDAALSGRRSESVDDHEILPGGGSRQRDGLVGRTGGRLACQRGRRARV